MAQLKDVNTTDVADGIRLGCRTMQRVFNADDNNIPFFSARAWPEASMEFMLPYTEAHVPGRHLLALLEAENALGVEVSEEAIEKHAKAAFYAFSGPVALHLNRTELGGKPVYFADHNLREGLHAMYALVKYRSHDRARQMAEACIRTIFEYWNADRGWDTPRLESLGVKPGLRTFIWGPGRSIGPLVKYYRATGYAPALELAVILAQKATDEFFRDDGAFDVQRFGYHTHSTTCTLSSLAQLADLLGDAQLMDRVKTFYDRGLWQIRDDLGWVVELADGGLNPDRGETNNTGDIVEAALILGRWGHGGCYHDAERIVRCHLLPSQLRDVSFIAEPLNPTGEDGKRDVARRLRGAFGFPAPYGHRPIGIDFVDFNLDIVGGGVSSLCEVWREAVRTDRSGHHVNLLFDHETDALRVESPYTHPHLRVTVKQPAPLWVRIPPWVDRSRLSVDAGAQPVRQRGEYVLVADPPLGRPLEFRFDLTEQTLLLRHLKRDIRVRLLGDSVAAMDNFDAELTFFDPLS